MKRKATDGKNQKTQPRPRPAHKLMPEPFDIPVPQKSQIMRDFEKIATVPVKKEPPDDD